jgi:hypothetical protein
MLYANFERHCTGSFQEIKISSDVLESLHQDNLTNADCNILPANLVPLPSAHCPPHLTDTNDFLEDVNWCYL